MIAFQNLSIQRKLIIIITLTSVVALLLAAAIYSTYDLVTLGRTMSRDLKVLANIIAANSRAALVFSDKKSAEDTLATFAAEEHIAAAVLYTTSGQPFAQYVRSDLASTFIAPAVQADRTEFKSDYLSLFQAIDRQGEHIGTIFLQSDTDVFYARLMQFISIGGLVILAVSVVALLLSGRLQKIISDPVLHLTQIAWRVSDAQDYSLRAVKTTNDELGFLIDRFNEMLAHVQDRDNRLSTLLKEQSVLFELSSIATSSLDGAAVLRQVASKISEIFAFDNVRIYSFAEEQDMLRPRAVVGYYDIEADFSPLFRGRGLVLKVSHTGQPLFFDDIQVNPTYAGMSQNSSSLRHGFHFLAMLPIKFSSRVLGVIACNSFTPRSISDNERRLLLSMVDQLGPALDNLNLAEALRNQGNDLENANRRLQELDRLKSHFLSNVSHELRTPLTAIGSLVDNMLDGVTGDISQKQTQYLTGVKESSERLTRMINDLLDLSIVQSGKFRLEPSRFSLGDLVHEIATSLGTVAQAKSVALQMPHASGDHLAWADRDRIAQVLNNLVGNAIKFTLAGGKVSVDIISTVENDNSIAVSVSDTGPGIPPEECEQIFDEFYQISRPGEEKVKGVGLGLAISKKLVEMNNGKISVESKIGSGTTFKFTVPAFREDSTIAEHYRGARI